MDQSASLLEEESFFPWTCELDQIRDDLDRKEPLVVGVSGKAGVQTSLAKRIAEIAATARWLVVPDDSKEALRVDKQTTPESFCEAVGDHLEARSPSSTLQQASLAQREIEVPALLRQAAPVLLVVDGFDPTAEFIVWFLNVFMAGMVAARSPVVVVCSDNNLDSGLFQSTAAKLYTLSRLEPERARKLIEAATGRLEPALEQSELESYVEAVSRRPELLDSLLKVLRLAEPVGIHG